MMARTARRPAYSPPKLDSQIPLALVLLAGRDHLCGLTANGLRCQFNLRLETAERLLAGETARRDQGRLL